MKDNQFSWFATAVIVVIAILFGLFGGKCSGSPRYSAIPVMDSITVDSTEIVLDDTLVLTELAMNKENFFLVCETLLIKHPDVVYAQARLESGNFTSAHYRNRNNFLGLYDSKRKRYMSFEHWTDCLVAYRDKVQYRYRRNSDRDDYLSWLVETGYAEDPDYVCKVRKLLK